MKTLKQLCRFDVTVSDGERTLVLKKGNEYITSLGRDGLVFLFASSWVEAPSSWFEVTEVFTKDNGHLNRR